MNKTLNLFLQKIRNNRLILIFTLFRDYIQTFLMKKLGYLEGF